MTVVGVDLGGSGSRMVAVGTNRTTTAGPAFAVVDGRAAHAEALHALVRAAGSVDEPVTAVAVSAAGLVSLGDPERIRAAAARIWPDAAIVVASDAVAAVVGAWDPRGGAVVAAGTGVVAFATNFADVWARSDGWGHLLGDAGGAAWIGARGLSAALRALDGRPGGSRELLDELRERFGDPLHIPETIRSAPNPATVLASFAPVVTDRARQGDRLASSIVDAAANELAATGISVLRTGVPKRLALVGGVAKDEGIATAFADTARAAVPDLEVVTDRGTPLDGAVALAELATDTTISPRPPYLFRYSTATTF